tara:strand:+ start:62 stop:748 length:687 start_codon:yes stop_codon:yes gene_type:complete
MSYLIDPPAVPTLPVRGTDARFPVHRIYCVGRNYADHAVEMGHDPDAEPPFFFMKPADAVLESGATFPYPSLSSDVQHEVELVLALGKGGRDIPLGDAEGCIVAAGVGIDMTRRDLQGEAKKMGRPWDSGKGFDHGAPCSELVPVAEPVELGSGSIQLTVNGETRQQGDLNQMIWKIPEIISRLSELFTLAPGDLIYTGTPAGVGPVTRGDQIRAEIDGLAALEVSVG